MNRIPIDSVKYLLGSSICLAVEFLGIFTGKYHDPIVQYPGAFFLYEKYSVLYFRATSPFSFLFIHEIDEIGSL